MMICGKDLLLSVNVLRSDFHPNMWGSIAVEYIFTRHFSIPIL